MFNLLILYKYVSRIFSVDVQEHKHPLMPLDKCAGVLNSLEFLSVSGWDGFCMFVTRRSFS